MPRDKNFEQRLLQVERNQDRMAREIDQIYGELRALGVDVPELNPGKKRKLSEQARVAVLRRAAAQARAAKEIGEGKGAVRDEETARRFREEARALMVEADEGYDDEP